MSVDLKNYVCTNPFRILELHETFNGLCIPEWLLKYIPIETELKDVWKSQVATDIRESVTDGSYKFCDTNQCPYLNYLLKYGKLDKSGPIVEKTSLNMDKLLSNSPRRIDLDFDNSCNYKCPSCRKKVYQASENEIVKIKNKIEEVEEVFGGTIQNLYLSASGDPLVSQSFRKFLQTFDESKFPELQAIHLHTNASMWNEKIWNSMPNVHKFIKSCEISIDAATKETYETQVRLNGNWDNLISNLKFISTIPTLKLVKPSFVVQRKNYKEMYDFTQLMKSIFGKKVLVLFVKMNNWGTFSGDEFLKEKIWDPSHPEHLDFLKELNKIIGETNVYHNMHDLINIEKNII